MVMSESTGSGSQGGAGGFRDEGFGPDGGADRNTGPAELELGDDDGRLPWLEADDEDYEYRSNGGQIAMLAVVALLLLALIVGGIWWFTRNHSDGNAMADGSVIKAPAEPYKAKPKDPGGKEFEGTGDTSFAVSEGETRTPQLAEGSIVPKPGFESVTKPAAQPAGEAVTKQPEAAPAQEPVPSGPAVQVGAYFSRAQAEAGWSSLSSRYESLSGQRYRIVEGKADIGTVFRLQVLPGDLAAARALCANLKSVGQDCSVKN